MYDHVVSETQVSAPDVRLRCGRLRDPARSEHASGANGVGRGKMDWGMGGTMGDGVAVGWEGGEGDCRRVEGGVTRAGG